MGLCRRKTQGQSAKRHFLYLFYQMRRSLKAKCPFLTRLNTSQDNLRLETKGRTCIFREWHQERWPHSHTINHQQNKKQRNLDHVGKKQLLPFEMQTQAASWVKSSPCKMSLHFFYYHGSVTSGRAWHLATSRWRNNMPITKRWHTTLFIKQSGLEWSRFKVRNDTRKRLIYWIGFNQSVTKPQKEFKHRSLVLAERFKLQTLTVWNEIMQR